MGKTMRANNPKTDKYKDSERFPHNKHDIDEDSKITYDPRVNENQGKVVHKKHFYLQRVWPNDSENKKHKGRKI